MWQIPGGGTFNASDTGGAPKTKTVPPAKHEGPPELHPPEATGPNRSNVAQQPETPI